MSGGIENPHPICYELKISVQNHEKEPLVNLFHRLGITEFVEGSVDCDIEFDYNTEHYRHDYYEDIDSLSPLVLFSEDLSYLQQCRAQLLESEEFSKYGWSPESLVLQPIADQNWRESWRASFQPILIGQGAQGFAIVPPWEAQNSFPQEHKIVIDPGMAFGTGQHETTHLCLQLLLEIAGQGNTLERVLDVGTGSGILAIAAKKLGAKSVLGNDIDTPSVKIATDNALENGCPDVVFTDEDLSKLSTAPGDLVFANIQFKPLVRLLPEISKRLNEKTQTVISGILASEQKEFCDELAKFNLVAHRVLQRGDWIGIWAKLKTEDSSEKETQL